MLTPVLFNLFHWSIDKGAESLDKGMPLHGYTPDQLTRQAALCLNSEVNLFIAFLAV